MALNKQFEQLPENEQLPMESGLKEGVKEVVDFEEAAGDLGRPDKQLGWYTDLEKYINKDLPWGLTRNEAGELVPPAAERLEALGITTPEKYEAIVSVSKVLGCDVEKLMTSIEANPLAMKSILDTTYGQDASYYNDVKKGMSYINSFADHFAKAESMVSDTGGNSYVTYNPEQPLKNIDQGYDQEKYQKLYNGIVSVFANYQSNYGLYKDAGINAFYTEYNRKYGTNMAVTE